MAKKTLLTTFVLAALQQMPAGTKIQLEDLYDNIRGFLQGGKLQNDPTYAALCKDLRACAARGDLANEPRYKNDVRQAIRQAASAGILKHVGTPRGGEWLRI